MVPHFLHTNSYNLVIHESWKHFWKTEMCDFIPCPFFTLCSKYCICPCKKTSHKKYSLNQIHCIFFGFQNPQAVRHCEKIPSWKLWKIYVISLGWKELAYSTSPGLPEHSIVAQTSKSFAQEAAEGQYLG